MEGKLGRSVCFFTLSDQAYPTFPDYFKTPKNRLSPCHSRLLLLMEPRRTTFTPTR
ncbi:hypothetical protein [Rubritalea tangerina]|uniref:hypothetical protein n=1 Tax=Rubritalea tangerina TaxID=430798 RepID=UPI0036146609